MPTSKPPIVSATEGEVLRLAPKVDLVASTVEIQRGAMMKALDSRQGAVVLDLSAVEQIDSLGITLVLGLFKTCQKAGNPFRIEGVRADIMRVFRLFNLPKFFSILEA
ncbi:MAG: STAS domain-containing protein [Holophaga sp.]|nr:STAS domain-containing protein [Holophaga sp.]